LELPKKSPSGLRTRRGRNFKGGENKRRGGGSYYGRTVIGVLIQSNGEIQGRKKSGPKGD